MIYQQLNQLGGLNTNLSPFLQPENSPTVMNGCLVNFKLGALIKDVGYKKVGGALESGKAITGLFDFKEPGGTQKMLATVNDATDDDTQLFYKTDAGAWTEIGAAETAWANFADIDVSMESFIGYSFFGGYGSTDGFLPVGSLTGTTFSTATNVTNMPKGKQVIKYRDRVYVINCQIGATNYPFRAYFSSVPAGGAITWTPASDFIDIDYGEELTGAGALWDRLILFTEDNAYFYDQSQKKHLWATGCSNWRTIQNSGPFMFWANGDGVWMSSGGQPQNIAGPAIDFIRAGNPRNFFGVIVDEEYHLYVGDVTVNGVSYKNCKLVFNIPTSTWRSRELANTMTVFARKNSSGSQKLYQGGTTYVWEHGKHTDATLLNDDDGVAIHSNFELAPISMSNLSFTKESDNINCLSERALGLKLKWRAVDRNARVLTTWKPLGELTKYVNTFDIDMKDGVLLQVGGAESGKNPYWSFFGYELDVKKHSEILKT